MMMDFLSIVGALPVSLLRLQDSCDAEIDCSALRRAL